MKRAEACSSCKIRPVRMAGQRYCKECHNSASKKYRDNVREELLTYRSMKNNFARNTQAGQG